MSDTQFFTWLCETIAELEDASEEEIANFHLLFMVNLCSRMGFLPSDSQSDQNRFFEIATASFVPKANIPSPTFDADISLIMHNLLSLPRAEALRLPLSGKQRGTFCKKCVDFLSYHLGIKIDVKSLAVLHDLFY